MSNEQSGQSRSEQPTPKKLQDSRKKGQVIRSRELNTLVMMVSGSFGLVIFGRSIGADLKEILSINLHITANTVINNELLIARLGSSVVSSLWMLLPFFSLMMLAAFVGPIVLGGWSFSMSSWQPKFSRMNPIAGLKRMFGVQGFVEMLKAFGKFVVIGLIATVVIGYNKDRIMSLGAMSVLDAIYSGIIIMSQLFIMLSLSLVLIALIDVPYQIVSHINKLKMTIQEIREESKQTNGNPELKARIRSMQREVSQRRMLQDIADADVVIVNPTHFSVALKYEQSSPGAPLVVAKGVDFMATRIREIANSNEVTVFSAPPLARALYHNTEIGDEVPSALYGAVAQVLAYVYQIRAAVGSEKSTIERPISFDIPSEFNWPANVDNTDDTNS